MNEYSDKSFQVEQDKPFELEDLLRYWQIIKQRIWILASTFLVILITGIIYTFNVTPVYQATTSILIEPDLPQVLNIDNLSPISKSQEFFETQIKIINSRTVIEKTVNALKRSDRHYGIKEDQEVEKSSLIGSLISRLEVETEKNTTLVKLSMKNTDPELAAKEINTLASTYINYNLEDRKATSKDAFLWLTEQLGVIKAKVEKSEMDLLKYKEVENIVSLEKRQTLLEERIAETSESLTKTTTNYMELKTMLDEIKSLEDWEYAESLPRILENPLVQQLKLEYNDLEIQLSKVSKKYKPAHPKIIDLKSQIENVRGRLEKEIGKTIKSIEIEAKIIETNVQIIERNLSQLKQQSMEIAKQAIQYGVLKREAESNKNMYDVLLTRLKETDISGRVTANNIRIVDAAIVPVSPVVPNKKLYLFATFIFALGLGIGFCFVAEFLDSTVKSENDIKIHLHQNVFGSIPFHKNAEEIHDDSFNSFSRAYNEIKTNISFYQKEHMLKSVLITSAEQSEGKTTSVYNLGKAFAKTGSKVLIIDADLFRPKLGKLLELENKKGVSDYLINEPTIKDLIIESKIKNLFILPAGLIPPNPAELIGSPKIKEMIDELKPDYDILLIDSAPINSTIEVSVLSSFADGLIMVIKAQNTSKQNLRKAIGNIQSKKANITGTILTSSKHSDKFSYYYYSKEV